MGAKYKDCVRLWVGNYGLNMILFFKSAVINPMHNGFISIQKHIKAEFQTLCLESLWDVFGKN